MGNGLRCLLNSKTCGYKLQHKKLKDLFHVGWKEIVKNGLEGFKFMSKLRKLKGQN